MTWKRARKLIEARRERVAALRLRGLTEREIVAALEQQGFINNETGKAYTQGSIHSDLKALQKQWLANAAQDIAVHKANQIAEIHELRRRNWAKDDLPEVRNCLILEAKILGTPAPEKLQVSGQIAFAKLTNEQLQRLVNGEPATDILTD
jgi:hypothetical protein